MGKAQAHGTIADAYLAGLVDGAQASGRGRLPPIRDLASRAGTSRSAMQRAVARLSAQGLIVARHGSGLALPGHSPSSPPGERRRPEDLCASLERDILSGRLPWGERIPSLKSLMGRYGASYRMLRRALEILAAEGALVRHRRSYRVRDRYPKRNQIMYLFAGVHLQNRPSPVHLHTLEQECARTNLRLVVARQRWQGRRLVFDREDLFTADRLADTIGFMVWTIGYDEQRCVELLGQLSRYRKPLAILDERHGYHRRRIPFAGRHVRCVVLAVREDEGETMGRYLLDRGHRRVLYVNHDLTEGHPPRLAGIRAVYTRAGLPGAVLEASLSEPVVAQQGPGSAHLSGIDTGTFDQEIDREPVTAVVGYNDTVALAALNRLRQRHIAVPERISVVGFDDSHAASLAELTSYNFNHQGAIKLLVGHVITGPGGRTGDSGLVDRIEGYVTERASSATVPRTPLRTGAV